MTVLLTWNIQCGLGVDGRVDLARIVDVATRDGVPDILCLQEVARHMPELDGGSGADQPAELMRLLPGFHAVYGAAIDRLGAGADRRQLGNLILSRSPASQVFRHALPQPADPDMKHMPRQATEVVLSTGTGLIRVLTTHLEFHSERQRLAQVARLRELHAEVGENLRAPPAAAPKMGPYAPVPRPETAILCGDFNAIPEDPVHDRVLKPFPSGVSSFHDAWRLCRPDRTHQPTCGIHDRDQWPGEPHCRDYVFVTDDLADDLLTIEIDGETDASDHQPVRVTFLDTG